MKSKFLDFFVKTKKVFVEFIYNRDGVTAIEYSLIAVAVTVLIIASFFYNDGSVIKAYSEKFSQLTELIQGALKGSDWLSLRNIDIW